MRIIDLSLPFRHLLPPYPGDPPTILSSVSDTANSDIQISHLSFSLHTGTHMDVPAHFIPGGKMINEYPPHAFIGRMMVVPLTQLDGVFHSDFDLELIQGVELLFFYCKISNDPGNENYIETPFSDQLIELILKVKPKAIGVNSMSPDKAPYPVHKKLLQEGICIIENLIQLEKIPFLTPFPCYCIPMLIEAEAAPIRVWVELEE